MGDDAIKFIWDFESHMTLMCIDPVTQVEKALAAFRLQLKGPALVWFEGLTALDKISFDTVKNRFLAEFNSPDSPTLVAEEVTFQNLKLEPSQKLDDFYTMVVRKGSLLRKSERDILNKFESGLPDKLAFFVRASRTTSIREAFNQARIGEAHGYRDQVPTLLQTSSLTSEKPKAFNKDRDPKDRRCFKCNGRRHIQSKCNWNGGPKSPDVQCQLCDQDGHSARHCKLNPSNINIIHKIKCQICGEAHSAKSCPQLNYNGLGQQRDSPAQM